jgi:hypothetical protein
VLRILPRAHPRFWNRAARILITGGGVTLGRRGAGDSGVHRPRSGAARGRRQGRSRWKCGIPLPEVLFAGVDEHGQLGFEVGPRQIVFFHLADGSAVESFGQAFGDSATATCADYDVRSGNLVVGSSDGRAALGSLQFETSWQGSERV